MTIHKHRARILLVVFCLLVLLFNYPLLSAFSKQANISEIPLLYVYILTIWLLFIVVIFFLTKSSKTES